MRSFVALRITEGKIPLWLFPYEGERIGTKVKDITDN
jgi:hypothetical protein